MNQQKVFNRVAKHLLTQRKKCETITGSCLYHSGKLACAVGALIKDKYYDPSLEFAPINASDEVQRAVAYSIGLHKACLPKRMMQMLTDLQKVHDEYDVRQWKKQLQRVAVEYDLSSKQIAELR